MHYSEYSHLYNDRAWRKQSKQFLLVNPFCQYCGKASSLVNHITPHKGNKVLFWSHDNWEPSCKQCHDSTVKRLEHGQVPGKDVVIDNRSDTDGMPISESHPWNK